MSARRHSRGGGSGCLKLVVALIVLGVLAALGLAGACSWAIYDNYRKLPPGARREVLYPKYRPTIEAVDAVLFQAASMAEARKAFQAIVVQDDVLVIELKMDGEMREEVVFKRILHTGRSMSAFHGAGYGSIQTRFGEVPVFVIACEAELKTGKPVRYTIFLRDTAAIVPNGATAIHAD